MYLRSWAGHAGSEKRGYLTRAVDAVAFARLHPVLQGVPDVGAFSAEADRYVAIAAFYTIDDVAIELDTLGIGVSQLAVRAFYGEVLL